MAADQAESARMWQTLAVRKPSQARNIWPLLVTTGLLSGCICDLHEAVREHVVSQNFVVGIPGRQKRHDAPCTFEVGSPTVFAGLDQFDVDEKESRSENNISANGVDVLYGRVHQL